MPFKFHRSSIRRLQVGNKRKFLRGFFCERIMSLTCRTDVSASLSQDRPFLPGVAGATPHTGGGGALRLRPFATEA
nr:unnamed protein product [Digitaria exilis]